jgi:hypothetical protein
MKRVVYTKEEFFTLIKNKDSIRDHLSKYLGIDVDDFNSYLSQHSTVIDDDKLSCVSSENLANYQKYTNYESKKLSTVLNKITKKKQIYISLIKSKYLFPVYISGDLFDKYIIRKYDDHQDKYNDSWKNGNDFKSIRSVKSVSKYLRESFVFLKLYKELDVKEKPSKQELMNETRERKIKKEFGSIHKVELNFAKKKFFKKKYDTFNLEIDQLKYDKISSNINTKHLYDGVDFYDYMSQQGGDKSRILNDLKKEDDLLMEKIYELKVKYFSNISKARLKAKNKKTTLTEYQDLKELYAQNLLNKSKYKKYQNLKGEIKYGIRPKAHSNSEKVNRFIKKTLLFYNIYGTDTIVDKYMDTLYAWNMQQMQPLSSKKYMFYRLAKAADGIFVLSTTILGIVLIPFTGGTSFFLANFINVITTDVFSFFVSLSRNEPIDSNAYRMTLRAIHAFIEGLFVPLATFNGFYTSIDDLRVALSLDQRMENIVKKNNSPIKIRPETLGRPVVLSLLRERYNYVAYGLLPVGKFLLMSENLNKDQLQFFRKILVDLQKVKHNLKYSLTQSAMRYEELLVAGKIPDHLIFDVTKHLQEYKKMEKFFSRPEYEESNIINSIMKDLISA